MSRSRRAFLLDLAAAMTLAGCGSAAGALTGKDGSDGGDGEGDTGAPPDVGSDAGVDAADGRVPGAFPVAVTSYGAFGDRADAVKRAVMLAGGTPWLKRGDTVLLKVAHNSANPYPFTASPAACVTLARMFLEAGAKRVYVADVMGIDATLVPGRGTLESPFGGPFDASSDATIAAFKKSGLYDALVAEFGASNIGRDRAIHITSFREDGWSAVETSSLTPDGKPRLVSDWVRAQLAKAESWTGGRPLAPFTPRAFDAEKGGRAGLWVPNLMLDVDHVVDVFRVSTHVMSHYSLSLKNWIGTMRPDDRVWMHQLGYLKNDRGVGDDPIRSEPPYNEIIAELHLATRGRERLYVADATEIIASGGPDGVDRGTYPANTIVAATDPISADVVGLSLIRLAVLASTLEGGLGGVCLPPPQDMQTLVLADLVANVIPWRGPMRGNDAKFCDTTFSPWDWIAVQRARELRIGALRPADVDLRISDEVSATRRAFLSKDALLPPARALTS